MQGDRGPAGRGAPGAPRGAQLPHGLSSMTKMMRAATTQTSALDFADLPDLDLYNKPVNC